LLDAVDAIVGELLHERALARRDEPHPHSDVFDVDSEGARIARILQRVARRQERLTGHAPAQNAKASEGPGVYQRYVAADVARGPGGGVSRRARTDDDQLMPARAALHQRPAGRAPSR
jgi:hypothetical protein